MSSFLWITGRHSAAVRTSAKKAINSASGHQKTVACLPPPSSVQAKSFPAPFPAGPLSPWAEARMKCASRGAVHSVEALAHLDSGSQMLFQLNTSLPQACLWLWKSELSGDYIRDESNTEIAD